MTETVTRPRHKPAICGGCKTAFMARFQWGQKQYQLYCSRSCYFAGQRAKDDPVARFWSKVEKRGPGECWGWKAQKRWDGYGRFVYQRRPLWAHRFSYELHHGQITKGMHVLHSCDNPECTNPAHLRLGTHEENMNDMRAKGRAYAGGNRRRPNGTLMPRDA